MDTGSHLLFGLTLAGLATLDPAVAQHPELAHAVIAATLIGSHAPDFDSFARLRGYAAYVKHHRGVTHSLPALFVWPALIAMPVAWLFGAEAYALHLYGWTMLAIVLHVVLDLFNAYGVQALRPFSRKWLHLDTLSLYEPFLFAIHAVGALLWLTTPIAPGTMFAVIYGITLGYIVIRYTHHSRLVAKVRAELGEGACHVVPGLHWFRWQFVLEQADRFIAGTIRRGSVVVREEYRKDRYNDIVKATLGTDGVRAFLHFAQRVHVTFAVKQDGYVVSWRDVRFWYDSKLPFGVDVQLDRNLNVVGDTLGWSKKAWDPPYV